MAMVRGMEIIWFNSSVQVVSSDEQTRRGRNMRLDVRRTLTGSPSPGDTAELKLEDGRTINLAYSPHVSYDYYVWQASEAGVMPEELKQPYAELLALIRSTEDEGWLSCYVDPDSGICEGAPLFLVIVPRGLMHDWPRIHTAVKVELITIT